MLENRCGIVDGERVLAVLQGQFGGRVEGLLQNTGAVARKDKPAIHIEIQDIRSQTFFWRIEHIGVETHQTLISAHIHPTVLGNIARRIVHVVRRQTIVCREVANRPVVNVVTVKSVECVQPQVVVVIFHDVVDGLLCQMSRHGQLHRLPASGIVTHQAAVVGAHPVVALRVFIHDCRAGIVEGCPFGCPQPFLLWGTPPVLILMDAPQTSVEGRHPYLTMAVSMQMVRICASQFRNLVERTLLLVEDEHTLRRTHKDGAVLLAQADAAQRETHVLFVYLRVVVLQPTTLCVHHIDAITDGQHPQVVAHHHQTLHIEGDRLPTPSHICHLQSTLIAVQFIESTILGANPQLTLRILTHLAHHIHIMRLTLGSKRAEVLR